MTTTSTETRDFFDYISDCLEQYDASQLDNDQDNFVRYLDLCRNYSWDIPSTLPCDHLDFDFPMHGRRSSRDFHNYPNLKDYFQSENDQWDIMIPHFKDIHGLDLTDQRINWNFDT